MSVIQDIKNDIRQAKKIRIPWWGVLLWMAICGFIELLFVSLGKFDLALPALNCAAIVGFTIALKRDLKRNAWFWATMTILATLHIPLVLFFPWTTQWVPALVIAAIDSADFCFILAVLAVVAKFMEKPGTLGSRPDVGR